MNTIKSVYYGWITLIVAGGGAYVFAKRSINADRAAKAELDRQKRVRQYELEYNHLNGPDATSQSKAPITSPRQNAPRNERHAGPEDSNNPSVQANQDPAPTRHAPEDAAKEKSKYEANVVYRSQKGDRFS